MPYLLRLYVTGATHCSIRAIANIHAICDKYLPHHCDLKIIDLYHNPSLARSQHILAAPTLVKERPGPQARVIGDLSDYQRVLRTLGLPLETETSIN